MSESIENGRSALLRPFSFEKWASEEIYSHSVNFAEKYLERYAVRAEQNNHDGALDPVDNRGVKALFWSGLAELNSGRGHDVEVDAWLDASEHIDVLLERLKVSYHAASYLEALALQLLQWTHCPCRERQQRRCIFSRTVLCTIPSKSSTCLHGINQLYFVKLFEIKTEYPEL